MDFWVVILLILALMIVAAGVTALVLLIGRRNRESAKPQPPGVPPGRAAAYPPAPQGRYGTPPAGSAQSGGYAGSPDTGSFARYPAAPGPVPPRPTGTYPHRSAATPPAGPAMPPSHASASPVVASAPVGGPSQLGEVLPVAVRRRITELVTAGDRAGAIQAYEDATSVPRHIAEQMIDAWR